MILLFMVHGYHLSVDSRSETVLSGGHSILTRLFLPQALFCKRTSMGYAYGIMMV